mmetsp:Transcript_4829/g.19338  ORF Transcript_4829/g.19338 Transcript_4829/m.19338 type:complete len:222 (-) Transcript_4829:262-927(-)
MRKTLSEALGFRTVSAPAPRVSKPTPMPSMLQSIKKQKGLVLSAARSLVDTKAQLFSAAKRSRSSVRTVPIAHNPRPGGSIFMWKTRSKRFCPSCCSFCSSQSATASPRALLPCSHRCAMRNVPFTTRSTVSCQRSFEPSGLVLEYVRRKTNSPRPLKPKGAGSVSKLRTKALSNSKASATLGSCVTKWHSPPSIGLACRNGDTRPCKGARNHGDDCSWVT